MLEQIAEVELQEEPKEYKLRVKKSRQIPFGWRQHTHNEKLLAPVPLELEMLQKAFKYTETGNYSWVEMADWLFKVTGRTISFTGYKKIYLKHKESQENT